MTTARQYSESSSYNPIALVSSKPQNAVVFHSIASPLLNQWHHLIEAIRDCATKRQWITLINPPFIPNDDYLNEIGLGDYYVRIIQFSSVSDMTNQHIQRCLQNGKSSIVALWQDKHDDLPDIILQDRPVGCRTLVFSGQNKHYSNVTDLFGHPIT